MSKGSSLLYAPHKGVGENKFLSKPNGSILSADETFLYANHFPGVAVAHLGSHRKLSVEGMSGIY